MRRLCFLIVASLLAGPAAADVYTLPDGSTVEGETYATYGNGIDVLEPSGRIAWVAGATDRVVAEAPEPWGADDMIADLKESLGPHALFFNKKPFVVAFVPEGRLIGAEIRRARGVLQTAGKFFKQCERIFFKFARSSGVRLERPQFPLPILIFETDEAFDAYAARGGGDRTSVTNFAGFYSHRPNHIIVRLSECDDFQTPLHEAIHMLCYNCGLVRRFADLPTWWVEGIATGFANSETRIDVGPRALNDQYVDRALSQADVSWDDLVAGKIPFYGDDSYRITYAQSWLLHWHLVNTRQRPYNEFVAELSRREPGPGPRVDHLATFRRVFGVSPDDLRAEAVAALRTAASRAPDKKLPAGLSETKDSLGLVQLRATAVGNRLRVGGQLRNVSTIRSLAYVVRVETTGGLFARWYYPEVAPRAWVPLAPQTPTLPMRGGPASASTRYYVRIDSALLGSDKARAWSAGRFEAPAFTP